jgi:hypothetical protein
LIDDHLGQRAGRFIVELNGAATDPVARLEDDVVGQAGERATGTAEAHAASLPQELGDLAQKGSSAVWRDTTRRLQVGQVVGERQHVRSGQTDRVDAPVRAVAAQRGREHAEGLHDTLEMAPTSRECDVVVVVLPRDDPLASWSPTSIPPR